MGYENIKQRKKLYKWGWVYEDGLTSSNSLLLSSRTDESAPRWTTAVFGTPS